MELFSQECRKKAEEASALLMKRGERVATAESCTGGLIAGLFTEFPGSSSWFLGSVVAYDNSVKHNILGVSNEILQEFGAVSEECVKEMLLGTHNSIKSDWALAVSGIAGPSGATPDKPLGTVFVGVSYKGKVLEVSHNVFAGDRVSVREQSVEKALDLLLFWLEKSQK